MLLKEHKKVLVVLAGPTAVGKTGISIELAKKLDGEVLNADSRQVYKEMNIGTAKVSLEEMAGINHHLVGHISVNQDYNAGSYVAEAENAIETIFQRKNFAFLVGGTGLYIDALINGLDDLPKIESNIRLMVMDLWKSGGLLGLQEKVKELDPVYWENVDKNNPSRLMKCLEVCYSSGRPYSSFLKQKEKKEWPFEIKKFLISGERAWLYERINKRVELMMEGGLLEEAKSLFEFRHLKALQTVGYQELFSYFEGKCSLKEAISMIQQHSRNYAKRQLTYFRKDGSYVWLNGEEPQKCVEQVAQSLLS